MLRSLALSLGLTLILELLGAFLFGFRQKRDLALVTLVNILTNPLIVLICNLYLIASGIPIPWYWILPLEVLAVLTEGFIYHKGLSHRPIHPLFLSLILNGISYIGGLLLS